MNKRIKELAKEAGAGEWGDSVVPAMMDIEKFAELIVRECCFVGEQYADGLFDSKHYAFVNKKVKEHFGVENGNSIDS